MKKLVPFMLVFVLLAFTGCDIVAPKGDTEIRPFTEQEKRLAESSNAFGFDLVKELNDGHEADGLFISPLSISIALAMALNGAEGNTLEELREVLKVDGMSLTEMNEAYRSLIALLHDMDERVDFRIANSLWYDNEFEVLQAFIDANREYFDALVERMDFRAPDAPDIINAWVSEKTNGLIDSVVDEIGPLVVMYLINAIYFKGQWTYQFDPDDTREADFETYTGETVRVPMMSIEGDFDFYADDRVQVVDLPYGNGRFSMMIALPLQNEDINDLVNDLDAGVWQAWIDGLRDIKALPVYLPKFKFEYDTSLVAPLESLGMVEAFDPERSDFRRINPDREDLYISEVIHKSFVEVNEEGTEAAAVTAVEFSFTSAGPMMRVDRPFLFAIRENVGGTILFMGKITDPS